MNMLDDFGSTMKNVVDIDALMKYSWGQRQESSFVREGRKVVLGAVLGSSGEAPGLRKSAECLAESPCSPQASIRHHCTSLHLLTVNCGT